MKNGFTQPDWVPRVPVGTRILITGATGGLGKSLVGMLVKRSTCVIGAHGSSQIPEFAGDRVIPLSQTFSDENSCCTLVDDYVEQSGGIDALVILSGSIRFSGHWMDMPADDWEDEISVNLNQPFYLARKAMKYMVSQKTGGRIIFTGTESALHGGSSISFPYAVAKRGVECMVQGLAREGAKDGILVNGMRLGCIASGFHERWHNKTREDMQKRAELIPLKRAGDPDEVAAFIIYLLSGYGGFVTGQMLPITGGDWL
ncbi:MAG: SDR family oxidoreductase [Pseudomonadota bacterium]|nr:SDR family oxidoreductase [Pseudomonadota bacterium]